MATITHRWRFDASRPFVSTPPSRHVGALFIRTVLLLFFAGCVLEIFR